MYPFIFFQYPSVGFDFLSDIFFWNFWRTWVLFVGPLITLFWTSGDVCLWFQSQGGFPCLHALSPACKEFLTFTSGVTRAYLSVASMEAELCHILAYKHWWGSSPGSSVRCLIFTMHWKYPTAEFYYIYCNQKLNTEKLLWCLVSLDQRLIEACCKWWLMRLMWNDSLSLVIYLDIAVVIVSAFTGLVYSLLILSRCCLSLCYNNQHISICLRVLRFPWEELYK